MADAALETVAAQRRQSRIIYLVLAGLMALFLVIPWEPRMLVGPQAQALYDAVEKIPQDKLTILSLNWSTGTIGENYPQTEALIQHLFMAHKRFAIFGIDPLGPRLGEQIAERQAKRLGKTYGVDWVNWGYRPYQIAIFLGMARDIPGTIKRDYNNTALSTFPAMAGIKSAKDLGMILEVTPSSTVGVWIQFFHGVAGTPIGYAPTAVMAPEAYPYLQSGQLVGMLAGIKGAAEYAVLLKQRSGPRAEFSYPALRAMNAVSIAHVMIVVLIVIGNLQYFIRRRRGEDAV